MLFKLSAMMFLQIFIWGAWFILTFSYIGARGLNFTEDQQFIITCGFPVASLIALFGLSSLVDRKFAAEKYMAGAHLVGGLSMIGLAFVTDFPSFAALMWLHCIAYVPTVSVANSITFANLKDSSQFGKVRLWGTIGWIAANWPFLIILTDWARIPAGSETLAFLDPKYGKADDAWRNGVTMAYIMGGVASLILSVFSLTLPHTPPKANATGLPVLKAFALLKKPFILVLFLVTFIDAAVHQSYFLTIESYLTEKVGLAAGLVVPVTSLCQIAEIFTMLMLGWFLKRAGWRTTMIIGILGHAVRFAVFAYFPQTVPAILVNVLHGICYAFFFATVYIFIDAYFPTDIRTSAQTLFNSAILGFGYMFANYVVFKQLIPKYKVDGKLDYASYFMWPMGAALVGSVLLLLFFHPPKPVVAEAGTSAAPH